MKNIGVIILGLGILITIFTCFTFITREDIVGNVQLTAIGSHGLNGSPFLGALLLVMGTAIFFVAPPTKKQTTQK